jgi:hypothetical protein
MIGGDLEVLLLLLVWTWLVVTLSDTDFKPYRSSILECSLGSSCRDGNPVLDRTNTHPHTLARSDLVREKPCVALEAVNRKNKLTLPK